MCEPTTMLIAAAAMSGVSAIQQQSAANAQANYQAEVAAVNAQTAEYEADYAREQAADEALKQRQYTAGYIGQQRAAMGASGLAADTGSFLNVTLDTAEQGALDEYAILEEGELAAWRYEQEAANYTAASEQYSASTFSPTAAGILTGASQGLSAYAMVK